MDTILPPKRNKNKFIKFFLIFLSIVIIFVLFIYYKNSETSIQLITKNTNQNEENKDKKEELICDRTTRLENQPQYDRALSLIYERLTKYGTDERLFPPQLINCIKVEEKNIKNDTGAEGYFNGSNDEIKSNYFPIVIDSWGSFDNDDLSTALLLVHEITHVQQYIDNYNLSVHEKGSPTILSALLYETKSSCLDKEVSAFKKQLIFTTKLKNEELKSIYSRIAMNEELNSQLTTLKTLKDSFENFNHDCEQYDFNCIESRINFHIYKLLRDSGLYDEQCGVYEGTYIGE